VHHLLAIALIFGILFIWIIASSSIDRNVSGHRHPQQPMLYDEEE
jgi:hypothetical protein